MGKKSKKNAETIIDTQMVEAAVVELLTANDPVTADVKTDEATLEAAVAQIEAQESVSEAAPVQSDEASAPIAIDTRTLDDVLNAISSETVGETVMLTAKAMDERADFEKAKNVDNDSIQKHLAKSRKQLTTHAAARVLIATNVSVSDLNREKHTGSRYNVYAMGKLADLISATEKGVISNKINFAIVKSLRAFQAAGVPFTSEMAKAAASDKVKVEPSFRKLLTSHDVSASTASTQASSTMQALMTLGVVNRSGGERNSTFTLTDTPVTRKLIGTLDKVAA